MAFQSQYAKYQQAGYPGQLERAGSPHGFDLGEAGVELQPGWGVQYLSASNDWRIPTSAATRLLVLGIVSYDSATVSSALTAVPAGANSDQVIKIADEAMIKIGVQGVFWAIAGEALEYGDLVVFDQGDDKDWIKLAKPAAFANLPKRGVMVVSPVAVASGDLVELSFGSGVIL